MTTSDRPHDNLSELESALIDVETFAYVGANKRLRDMLDPPTVRALIERIQALEEAAYEITDDPGMWFHPGHTALLKLVGRHTFEQEDET